MKAVLLGNIPLGTKILHLFIENNVDVVGVVCEKRSVDYPYHEFSDYGCVFDYAIKNNISIFTPDQIISKFPKYELDFAISARNSEILKEDFLYHFRKGVINCHGGPLPEFRGLNSSNFCILTNQKKFGATIHYMTKEIDEGPIIARKWFDVSDNDTVYDVFLKVEFSLYELIEDNIFDIINDKEKKISQDFFINNGELVHYYNKEALEKFREITDLSDYEKIYTITRAFDFPGHEKAYIRHKNKKIFLSLRCEK